MTQPSTLSEDYIKKQCRKLWLVSQKTTQSTKWMATCPIHITMLIKWSLLTWALGDWGVPALFPGTNDFLEGKGTRLCNWNGDRKEGDGHSQQGMCGTWRKKYSSFNGSLYSRLCWPKPQFCSSTLGFLVSLCPTLALGTQREAQTVIPFYTVCVGNRDQSLGDGCEACPTR